MIDLYKAQINHNLSFVHNELLGFKDANKRNILLKEIKKTEEIAAQAINLGVVMEMWIISLALVDEVVLSKKVCAEQFFNPIED